MDQPEIIDGVITAVVAIVAPLLLLAVRQAVAYLEKISSVKLSEQSRQDIEYAIDTAIRYAEEEARRRARTGDFPLRGENKRNLARVKARSFARDGLHQIADIDLNDLIDARVNTLRPSMHPPALDSVRPEIE